MVACRYLVFFWCHIIVDQTFTLFLLHHSVSSTVLEKDNDKDDGEYAGKNKQDIQHDVTLAGRTRCALKHSIYNSNQKYQTNVIVDTQFDNK